MFTLFIKTNKNFKQQWKNNFYSVIHKPAHYKVLSQEKYDEIIKILQLTITALGDQVRKIEKSSFNHLLLNMLQLTSQQRHKPRTAAEISK